MDTKLLSLFEQIEAPPKPNDEQPVYAARQIPFSESYRIGKDSNGAPALVIQNLENDAMSRAPIRLRHLHVMHDVECLVHRGSHTESGNFSVLACVEADRVTESYFLRILEALLPILGEFPTPNSINEAIEKLIELFQSLGMEPRKRTQGLWAELLLIAESQDPAVLVETWHGVPRAVHDFAKDNQRIEVKCTTGDTRAHHFSLTQLQTLDSLQVMVASVMLSRDNEGTTIVDLLEELRHVLKEQPALLLRLYQVVALTLGERFEELATEAFDRAEAVHSLAFYGAEDIPSVSSELPPGVSRVRFQADLTGLVPCSKSDMRSLGGLMAAAAG